MCESTTCAEGSSEILFDEAPRSQFVWSPDRQKIAYEVNSEIYVINTDGSDSPVKNTAAYYTWIKNETASPDGKKQLT